MVLSHLQILLYLFDLPSVDDKDNILDSERGLRNVRRQHNLPYSRRGGAEYHPLVGRHHLGVQRQHQQTRIAAETLLECHNVFVAG